MEIRISQGKGMAINFIDKAIEDVYDILISDAVPWPEQFTHEMKVAVYDAQITYWFDYESYERISELENKKKQL